MNTGWLIYGAVVAVPALVLIALGLGQRRARSRRRRFWAGRVTGITGAKGGGKTLFCVWQAVRQLTWPVENSLWKPWSKDPAFKCQRAYGTVAANFTLDVSRIRRVRGRRMAPPPPCNVVIVRAWRDLLLLPPFTLVILDEVGLWAPLRQGQSLPQDVALVLKQCRKLFIEIMWLDQDEANVATGLRRQTDFYAECQFLGSYHRAEFFKPRQFPPKPGVRPMWRFRYRSTEALSYVYDTMELVRPARDMNEVPDLEELVAASLAGRRLSLAPRASEEQAAGPAAAEVAS